MSHHNNAFTITVRVHPHAKQTRIKETMSDGSLKIDLKAAAEDGKANEELRRFLAEHYSVPVSQVEIVSGQTSRRKIVRITGSSL